MAHLNMHAGTEMTRRNAVKGAALAGAAALVPMAAAHAEEASQGYTFADTVAWDNEYDVVVLGMGMAGMAAALSASKAGASVLRCEKASEGHAGGNSKICAQFFIWGNNDADAMREYFTAMAADRQIPDDVLNVMAEGVANMAETLAERYGFNQDEYVDFTDFGFYLSPEYPEFAGSDKLSFMTAHKGYGDSFVYQTLKRLVAQDANIDVWYESPATELFQDPMSKAVVGVSVERAGGVRNVRALNGVCVCTGGFENDREMAQHYCDLVNYAVCGGLYNTGDGVKMCQKVGARLWHMTAYEGDCQNALAGISFDTEWGTRANMVRLGDNYEMSSGAVMLVGTWGKRFCDESVKTRHGHIPNGNGIWEHPDFSQRTWLVWDETQNELIEGAGLIPEVFAADVLSFASIEELAAAIETPADTLAQTIENFNKFANEGVDWEFGRNPETMRAFDGKGYYAVRVKQAILNTQGGPERNGEAEVLDLDGNPIPHLYSAGELGGFTTCMYQGGANTSECYIFGHIAGANAAQAKDPLPAYTLAPAVESNPAHLGEENDLVLTEDEAGVDANGLLTGSSNSGMGGKVSVTVTLDADGKISKVEVTRESETEGIGSKAIEAMPAEFVGCSTAEEIDALDTVSGATVTSNALKEAVKAAMGL